MNKLDLKTLALIIGTSFSIFFFFDDRHADTDDLIRLEKQVEKLEDRIIKLEERRND